MAENVNANIRIDVDAAGAIADLRSLQAAINNINKSVLPSRVASNQRAWNRDLLDNIATQTQYVASIQQTESSISRLSKSIEKGHTSVDLLRQSFQRYNEGVTTNNQIHRIAEQRVRHLNTQYLALGDSVNGVSRAIALRPISSLGSGAEINNQRLQLMNKLLDNGTTRLVNWGKNTQWAGRQLAVGLGVPLTLFGTQAAKIFTDLEKSTIAFRRVYGDLGITKEETNAQLEQIQGLAKEFTKYGIAASDTINLSAKAAAAGFQGEDLQDQTTEATRLAVLGQIDYQQALEATITLNSAFGVSNAELKDSINFLNAAENQTVLSLDDISRAIPRVGPVVKQLGGDVETLAVFMTALREGGVTAEQGANALKSGLASLINPTNKAVEVLKKYGINIKGLIKANEGDLLATVQNTAKAFDNLTDIDRQRALEVLFGKFQYSRIGALFDNINRKGGQAAKTIELMGYSTEQLASIASEEMKVVEDAVSTNFTEALEKAKLAIAPIGKEILKIATFLLGPITKALELFDSLSDGAKAWGAALVGVAGIAVPGIITLIGLLANFAGSVTKGFLSFLRFIRVIPKETAHVEEAELRAAAATNSLESATRRAASATQAQANAISNLNKVLELYISTAARADAVSFRNNINVAEGAVQSLGIPRQTRKPTGYASGGMVGGRGNKDTEPALLTPGEFVMNRKASEKYGPILAAMNKGNIAGYALGRTPRVVSAPNGESVSIVATEAVAARFGRVLYTLAENGKDVSAELVRMRGYFRETEQGLVITNVGIKKYRDSFSDLAATYSQLTTDFTHLHTVTQDSAKALQILDANAEKFTASAQAQLALAKRVEEILPGKVKFSAFSAAGISAPSALNRGLQQGVSGEAAARLLGGTQGGAAKVFENYVKETSLTVQQADKLLEQFVANLSSENRVIKDIVQEGETGAVAFGEVWDKTVSQFTQDNAQLKAEFDRLEQTLLSFRLLVGKITEGEAAKLAAAGIASTGGTVSGLGSSIITGTSKTKDIGARGVLLGQKLVDQVGVGILRGAQTASPPPWSINLGRFISEGVEQGAVSGLAGMEARVKAAMAAGIGPILPSGPASPYVLGGVDPNVLIENEENLRRSSGQIEEETKQRRGVVGALKKNALKLQAAFIGLDTLAFGLTFLDGQIGQIAQSILPAIFGIQALAGILPLLTNPISIAIAAFAAVGVGLFFLKSKIDASAAEVAKVNESIGGVGNSLSAIAESFGGIDPRKEWNSFLSGISARSKKDEEILSEGRKFVEETEGGKKLLEDLKRLSGQERIDALKLKIDTALAFGEIKKKDADAIVAGLAEKLNDPILGKAVSQGISSGLDRETLRDNLIDVYTEAANSAISRAPLPFNVTGDFNVPDIATTNGFSLDDEQQALSQLISAQEQISIVRSSIQNQLRTATGDARKELQNQLNEVSDKSREIAEAVNNVYSSIGSNAAFVIGPSVDAAFSKLLKNISEAKNLGDDFFNSMEQNARNLESVLSDFGLTEEQREEVSRSFQAQAISGAIDPTTDYGSIYKELVDSGAQYKKILEETDPSNLIEVLRTLQNIKTLNPESQSIALTNLAKALGLGGRAATAAAGGLKGIDSVLADLSINSSFFTDNTEANSAAFRLLTEEVGKFDLEKMQKLNDLYKSLQEAGGGQFALQGEELIDSLNKFNNKLTKKFPDGKIKLNASISTSLWNKNLKELELSYDEFNKLPDLTKRAILYKFEVLAQIDLKIESLTSKSNFGTGYADILAFAELDKAKREQEASIKDLLDIGNGGGTEKEKGGGGSASKSFYEQLLADYKANSRLFLADVGKDTRSIVQKLRSLGIPQQIIDAIGSGESGLKNAQSLLKAGKKKLLQLIKKNSESIVGELQNKYQGAVTTKLFEGRATKLLVKAGLTEEEAKRFAESDPFGIVAAAQMGGKAWKNTVRLIKQQLEEVEEIDPIKLFDDEFARREAAVTLKANEDFVAKYGKSVTEVQGQIAANELTIEQIRHDQIRPIEEAIAAKERLNDLDQESIDKLNREKELRNQQEQDLNHTLDMISEQEDAIKKAYDNRIAALQKVQKINEQIARSQKSQLDIADALTSGDISRAAAALQQYQADQAAAAAQQNQDALQNARDAAVASVSVNGQTRADIEAKIKDIKELNYQTDLKIRKIETDIYNRTKEIKDKNEEIYQINVNQIQPLERQNEQYQHTLNKFNTQLEITRSAIAVNGLHKSSWDAIKGVIEASTGAVGDYSKALDDVLKKLNQITGAPTNLVSPPKTNTPPQATGTPNTKVGNITYDSQGKGYTVLPGFGIVVPAYAKGGRVYAAGGNVMGDGSRDSVNAMLTPGEFVMRKAAVQKYGNPMMTALNNGSFTAPKYNMGSVPTYSSRMTSNVKSETNLYNSNYSVNVNVSGTNASADDIANRTISKIRDMNSMNIRRRSGY